MGIKSLQEYIETHCSSACVSVDLLKIAKGFVPKRRGRYPGSGRFCLVVDAESCLDRLYGGFYSDWVCGGQWNRVTAFLNSLVQACHSANMELVVFFNGALESQKLNDWFSEQVNQRNKVESVFRHIDRQGKPPPKVWWTPPVFLTGTLRMALREMGVGVACSMDDHAQEVIGYCREHDLQGIIAQNAVYTIFDPPRYFSSHNLKLTYKGSLETKEYIMDEIAKCLDLNPNRFCILAAMLGNHILPDEDLYDFYRELLTKTQEPGKSVKFTPESAIRSAVDFVRSLPSVDNLDAVGETIFKNYKSNKRELIAKFRQCVQYYLNGTQDGFLKYGPPSQMMGGGGGGGGIPQGPYPMQHLMQNKPPQQMQNKAPPQPPRGPEPDSNLPKISPEIMRIASERHQKGLMCPWVYQLLSQGEVKFNVALEDERDRELPTAMELYRPVRQTVYSVLFNLNKLKIDYENKDKTGAAGDASPPTSSKRFEVPVKEWVVRRGTNRPSFEMVMAMPVDWKTPSIERMWLGTKVEDKSRRLRAFLTCMRSSNKLMINTQYVPQQLLVFCCVLRYILQYGKVLRRPELDAFLAMTVSPRLHDVQTMQDLMLPSVSHRGVQLASLFMSGVETAVFANDVCGSPVPWNVCAPWHFFDGKLFHYKLLKANQNLPLIDICDGQINQVRQVESMRQAIMEDIHVEFPRPNLPTAALYGQYPHSPYPPFACGILPPPPQVARGMRPPQGIPAGMGMNQNAPKPGRGRGILGRSPVDSRGGQLEIAGVVVGSWGPNLSGGRENEDMGRQGPNMSPRVMSVGGPRGRFSRGGMNMGMRGGFNMGRGGMPMRGGMNMNMGRPMGMNMRPAGMGGRGPGLMYRGPMPRAFRARMPPMFGMGRGVRMAERGYHQRGRGVVRGVRRPQVQVRPRPTKSKGNGVKSSTGKGRGMTVEPVTDGAEETVVNGDEEYDETSNGNYADAEDGTISPIGKGALMHDNIHSPDSGIHGDKSQTELNVTA